MPRRKEPLTAVLAILAAQTLAAPTPTDAVWPSRATPNPLDGELSYLLNSKQKRQASASLANVAMPVLNAQGCFPAGTTALQMNAYLSAGGPNTNVVLCPSASYDLNNTIIFTADSQQLSTLGYPTDGTRATLTVVNAAMSVAVYGACNTCSNIQIRSITINGNRPSLGPFQAGKGGALVEIGGNVMGQVVRDSHLYEPRGWSCLHSIEGDGHSCRNTTFIGNTVGPSGNSPNSAQQFRRRDAVTQPGLWADGISLACGSSLVANNTIIDATDGGIVVFGAAGSRILNNTIMSVTRVLLGGINMVDTGAWGGNYTGTVVDGNTLMTLGSMIKIGIPLGPNNWAGINNTAYRTFNGQVTNNRFISQSGGYFGFAITASGHNNTHVANNDVSAAKYGAVPSAFCIQNALPPVSQSPGIFYDPYTSFGDWSGQPNAQATTVAFLICVMESSFATVSGASSAPATAATTNPATAATTQLSARATILKSGKTPGKQGSSGAAKPLSGGKLPSAKQPAASGKGKRQGPLLQREGPSPWSRQDVLEGQI